MTVTADGRILDTPPFRALCGRVFFVAVLTCDRSYAIIDTDTIMGRRTGMKVQTFSIKSKGEIFEHADPMHDCSFVAMYDNGILTLVFDGLERYCGPAPTSGTPWFGDFKKLTVRFSGCKSLTLELKHGRKEKDFYDTLAWLENKELVMFKYSIDSFDEMQLHFTAYEKRRSWGGIISVNPAQIEYVWE